MNDPTCLVCTPELRVHGEQSPSAEEVTHAAEVDALKAELIHANEARDAARDAETDLRAEVEQLKNSAGSTSAGVLDKAIRAENEACAAVLQHFFRRAEHPLPAGQSIPTNLQINHILREAESAIRARGQR